jgi:hypothetical protein
VTVTPIVPTDVSARRIGVFVPAAFPNIQGWVRFFVSYESSTEYTIGESASIATAPLDVSTEARQRLVVLRERATHRVRLLPSYEETAEEIAERTSEHEGLFEMQRRTKAWSAEG